MHSKNLNTVSEDDTSVASSSIRLDVYLFPPNWPQETRTVSLTQKSIEEVSNCLKQLVGITLSKKLNGYVSTNNNDGNIKR
jgi:hypothetical protein